jgi:hypothetical protein
MQSRVDFGSPLAVGPLDEIFTTAVVMITPIAAETDLVYAALYTDRATKALVIVSEDYLRTAWFPRIAVFHYTPLMGRKKQRNFNGLPLSAPADPN